MPYPLGILAPDVDFAGELTLDQANALTDLHPTTIETVIPYRGDPAVISVAPIDQGDPYFHPAQTLPAIIVNAAGPAHAGSSWWLVAGLVAVAAIGLRKGGGRRGGSSW